MQDKLIKEYVRLVLEKIRTVKKGSPFGDRFDVRKFKSLENIEFMKAYADSFLEMLGEGSSRVAYALSSNKVLKIALNKKGIDQNIAELDVFTNPLTKPMISKIQDYDNDYRWLIADSVRIFNNESEFEKETGLAFQSFVEEVKNALVKSVPPESELAANTVKTIENSELMLGDVARIEHWGKSADGRVVLLDYGFTKEVWKTHYAKKAPPKPPRNPKKLRNIEDPIAYASTEKATIPVKKTDDLPTLPLTISTRRVD
jgi:hypothetical protein